MIVHLKTKYPVRTIRKKHQASIVYTHARKSPSEPSERHRGVNHLHARTKYPVRTVRYVQRRQSCTRTNEIARPNRQIRTKASMAVPLNTNTHVTVLQNHEGVMLFFARGPTLACKRRRWRGPTPAAFFMRVVCRQPWRSRKPPAARLRPSVGPLSKIYLFLVL